MTDALDTRVASVRGVSEAALDDPLWGGRQARCGAGQWTVAGLGEVGGEIGDEHFGDGDSLLGDDLAEEGEGAGLSGAIGTQVAVGSDPPLFVSLFDLIGAGDGLGMRTSDEDSEALAVVITGMIFGDADGEVGD